LLQDNIGDAGAASTGVADAVLIEPKLRQTAARPWRMRRRRKNAVRTSGSRGASGEKMAWRNQKGASNLHPTGRVQAMKKWIFGFSFQTFGTFDAFRMVDDLGILGVPP
jgi:hypothetical protein